MSQITSGIRAVLSHPSVYNSFQALLGANRGCELFAADNLRIKGGQTVLDIGCGTAEMLNYLPQGIDYYGFDISAEYIASARKKFQRYNAQFVHGLFDIDATAALPEIDVAYTSGVFHHMDDQEVRDLLQLVSSVLKPGGRFISVDPCFIDEQNIFAKFLIERDRGQNIRRPDQLRELAAPYFARVEVQHRSDFLRIPYDHAVLECRSAETVGE